jgi:hypothetical protein
MLSNPTVIRRLLKEVSRLRSEPPEGIRVKTNDEDILDLIGIIEGPGEPKSSISNILNSIILKLKHHMKAVTSM